MLKDIFLNFIFLFYLPVLISFRQETWSISKLFIHHFSLRKLPFLLEEMVKLMVRVRKKRLWQRKVVDAGDLWITILQHGPLQNCVFNKNAQLNYILLQSRTVAQCKNKNQALQAIPVLISQITHPLYMYLRKRNLDSSIGQNESKPYCF